MSWWMLSFEIVSSWANFLLLIFFWLWPIQCIMLLPGPLPQLLLRYCCLQDYFLHHLSCHCNTSSWEHTLLFSSLLFHFYLLYWFWMDQNHIHSHLLIQILHFLTAGFTNFCCMIFILVLFFFYLIDDLKIKVAATILCNMFYFNMIFIMFTITCFNSLKIFRCMESQSLVVHSV